MQSQCAPVSVQAYYHAKRQNEYNTPITVANSTSMVFNDYGKAGARGIRSWQKAKFDNYDQRAKQDKYYEDQRKLNQLKRRQEYEATKSVRDELEKQQREKEKIERQRICEIQNLNRVVIDSSMLSKECNDAW